MSYFILPFILGTVSAFFTFLSFHHYKRMLNGYVKYEYETSRRWGGEWLKMTVAARFGFQVTLIITAVFFFLGIAALINWMWG